jgi:hypothetical protein
VTIPDGRPVTFGLSGKASGETYLWLRDGVTIPGANGPTLTVTSNVPSATKTYTARVTNGSGTTVSSGTLTVREALLAEWLADRGLNGLLADHDSDGDGTINSAEYLARTDPVSANSVFGTRAVPSPGYIRLLWPTYPGRTYQVYRSETLGTWTPVGAAVMGDGLEKSADVPVSSMSARTFLRVGVTKP